MLAQLQQPPPTSDPDSMSHITSPSFGMHRVHGYIMQIFPISKVAPPSLKVRWRLAKIQNLSQIFSRLTVTREFVIGMQCAAQPSLQQFAEFPTISIIFTWFTEFHVFRQRGHVFDEVVRILPIRQTILRVLKRHYVVVTLELVLLLQL